MLSDNEQGVCENTRFDDRKNTTRLASRRWHQYGGLNVQVIYRVVVINVVRIKTETNPGNTSMVENKGVARVSIYLQRRTCFEHLLTRSVVGKPSAGVLRPPAFSSTISLLESHSINQIDKNLRQRLSSNLPTASMPPAWMQCIEVPAISVTWPPS